MDHPRSSTPFSGQRFFSRSPLPHHRDRARYIPDDAQCFEEFSKCQQPDTRSSTPSDYSSSSYTTASDTLTSEDSVIYSSDKCDLPTTTPSSIQNAITPLRIITSLKSPTELNPLATPFSPSQESPVVVLSAAAPPFSPSQESPVAVRPPVGPLAPQPTRRSTKVAPPWTPLFESGARSDANNPQLVSDHAGALVTFGPWALRDIAELVKHFTWMACHVKAGMSHNALALFAMEVYRKFSEHHGAEKGDNFVWHLRACVLDTFRNCWRTENSTRALSYKLASPAYVAAALSLTSFIGDLFVFNFMLPPHISMCINILLAELNSHEHIDAIYNLLSHCGPRYWSNNGKSCTPDPAVVDEFINAFIHNASSVSWDMSLLGVHPSATPRQHEDRIQSIVGLLGHWVIQSNHATGGQGLLPEHPLYATPKPDSQFRMYRSLEISPIQTM